jgi:hypothetical protein
MLRRLIVLAALMALGALFVASSAGAAPVTIKKWESLTCKENKDLPPTLGVPEVGPESLLPVPPEQCTGATPSKFFTQAAGHPDYGITDFRIATYPALAKVGGFPTSFLKKIVVDTPEGLSVNPEALPQCPIASFEAATCATTTPGSLVGTNYLTVAAQTPTAGECAAPFPNECAQARVALPVWNLESFKGVPSMVGFNTTTGHPVFIVGSLSPVDQHVTFTISDIEPPSPTSPPIIESRLVFNGKAGNGTYLTMPSNCAGGQISDLNLESQGPPIEPTTTAEKSYETSVGATGCENVPFEPTIAVDPTGAKAVDSPEPTTVDVGIPFDSAKPISNSYLQTAKVVLPEGMGINPSSANGLGVCSEAQFGYHTNNPISCPSDSQIGTVEVQTPSLPPNSIGGAVYVGEPLKQGPGASQSGEQFRILIHAFSERYGVNVRLKGKIFPDPVTGQITALVEENPQATFSNFRLHFFGGDRGTLTSPPTCAPSKTETVLTPWSGQANATPSSSFSLTSFPGGGSCPDSLAARPFSPGYSAVAADTSAGKSTSFRVNITRNDGQQELKVVNVTLPKGLTGKLDGIPYCPEANIASAEGSSGYVQQGTTSCGPTPQLGTATVTAGSGGAPFKIEGRVFLAGPYKGAPLSLVVITPAVAGPYDLGTVVVRVALNVNPGTAQVNAVSDPIPNVFGGVKLDIRSIDFNIDRSGFMQNPTNCAAGATAGVINGGGGNPANPAQFSSYNVSSPYQASGCNKLNFKPKLHVRIYGPTTRAKNTRIRAILESGNGQANVARTALNLPHSLFLDQSHIKTVCTRVQLAAKQCPQGAVYGHAEAKSPLLQRKLSGPVYLVSSNDQLPNLVADLQGQVNIQLRGVISSKHGGLKTVFPEVPDVPVSKFILNMQGGKKSLIENSENLCKSPQRAILNLKGQNGKQVKSNQFPLAIDKCGAGKKKGK